MKVKEESAKVDLKFKIRKIKSMVSGPITSWQIDGETVESVDDFIWGRSEERRVGKEWTQWLTLFLGAPKSLQMVTAAMKLKDAYSLEGKL